MTKDAEYEYKVKAEKRTFVYLAIGANILIKKTEQDNCGSFYTTMASLLLTAFSFEAYLNHLGSKTFKLWDKIESIKVMNKYCVLCEHLNITPVFSQRPCQTLKTLFKFRNLMAHGKTEVIEETHDLNFQNDPYDIPSPKTGWEEYCGIDNAIESRRGYFDNYQRTTQGRWFKR